MAGKSTKAKLSRARILEVAIPFADAHGLDNLNMRRLAAELGSPVMSLYTHVRNKDELLDLMTDEVAGEIRLPKSGAAWRDALTQIATSAFITFYRHPWVIGLWNVASGPAKLAHQESILRVMREAGFSVRLACRGYHAITMHITGFTMQAAQFPSDAGAMKAAAETFLAEADPREIPFFVEHVQYHQDHPEPDGEFEFVLDMILDGLEKRLEDT